jgi:hypothetical protein
MSHDATSIAGLWMGLGYPLDFGVTLAGVPKKRSKVKFRVFFTSQERRRLGLAHLLGRLMHEEEFADPDDVVFAMKTIDSAIGNRDYRLRRDTIEFPDDPA